MIFSVYIIECRDGSLYTGYTNDITTRIAEHNGESKKPGAKYTRGRRPVQLRYQEIVGSKSAAMKREYEIKQLTRVEKQTLILKHSTQNV